VIESAAVNYPDILKTITGGSRLNLDVIQCAVAMRPAQIPAGQTTEIVLLLQNASDIDVDVVVQPHPPSRDADRQKGCFEPHSKRLLVGLRPAEAGFVTLPVTISPRTTPAPDYSMDLDLSIDRLGKTPHRLRLPQGGGAVSLADLPPEAQVHIRALSELSFSATPGSKKSHIQTGFSVQPAAIAALNTPKPDWISLWTLRDHMDIYAVAARVQDPVQNALVQFRREHVFMPLLKTTQERFKAAGYPLLPPEAIFITKLLTLILETSIAEPSPLDPRPAWPRWYGRLCRLLLDEPGLAQQTELLVTHLLYEDLLYDAILGSFEMVQDTTKEDFGNQQEVMVYAQGMLDALANKGQTLDFARIYLPLVMGGLIINARVTMPREQVRETVFILSKALDRRQNERTQANAFVFDLTNTLIDHTLNSI
jgi:hypothetical protein